MFINFIADLLRSAAGRWCRMQSLSRYEIYRLREHGYPLDGDNWMKVHARNEMALSGLRVSKICNGDTLTVVMVPEDILASVDMTIQ